jgi:hypothetical protein
MAADSGPYRALAKARAVDILALSPAVLDVLHRPGLARFINPRLRDDVLDGLTSASAWFEPTVVVTDCRDPTDNKYLELALASGAPTIVSSDKDLLALDPWNGVRILRPAAYLTTE